ncbi:MAG: molybdopterin-guanine dinucleotide biosynthesis protein B [Candidatus Cloacimonadota bacterium]|nr:MAG: molybdopterin-guanine dinucleotide biosynthesis protein B [Candidatus Cloacimonadota bacterium]
MTRIFSFIGHSNSGKTTLIARIITELKKRRYSVGAVKSSSVACEVDSKGKDSYRLREKGADPVLLVSKSDIALFSQNNGDNPKDLIERYFPNSDFVLIEGGKNWNGIKKIEVIAALEKRLPLKEKPIAIISDERVDAHIPQFKRDEVEEIVNLLEKENG